MYNRGREGLVIFRFFFDRPYPLRSPVEQQTDVPAATQSDRDFPIPLDAYQEGDMVVVEAALPGASLEDIEISCDEGLLFVRADISGAEHDFAVREIPRGTFSRVLAMPRACRPEEARATYQDGILRISLPQTKPAAAHSVKVTIATETGEPSRIVMQQAPQVVDAVKGEGYNEVKATARKKRGQSK